MRIVWYRGSWAVYWREDGKPRRVSLGTTDKGEAERRLLDWKGEQRRTAPLVTCGDIVSAFISDKEDRGTNTAETYRQHWKAMASTFNHLEPRHITRELCREYTAKARTQGRSDSTIRGRFAVLSAALRWHNPRHEAVTEMPPPAPPRERHLTKKEASDLVSAASITPHIHTFVVLALTTGARASAILELTWRRVDLNKGVLDFGRGSGNKRRSIVPINATCRDVLVRAREAAETDYVVEYAGEPVRSIKKAFARACQRGGLHGVSPHTLRHTAAVWMAEAGLDMAEIAQYLGHTNLYTTYRVYARFSPNHQRRAAEALEIEACSSEHSGTKFRKAK